MSAQMLGVSLLGVGTVLRLERDVGSMAERRRQATNKYAPPGAIQKKQEIKGVLLCLYVPVCYSSSL